MKVLYTNHWLGNKQSPNSVSYSIQHKLDKADYGDGQIEGLGTKLSKVKEFLGELVETLNNKGLLTDDEVLSLLGSDYYKSEEKDDV